MATTSRDRYTLLFWVLAGCTVVTVIITLLMMYRMSQKPPVAALKPGPAAATPGPKVPQIPASAKPSARPTAVSDNFAASSRDIVYVYSNTCGWCERFNPVWKDFEDRYSGSLNVLKVEAREPQAKQYQVSGYPTVMVVDNGEQTALFKDERTVENLLRFARENEPSTA